MSLRMRLLSIQNTSNVFYWFLGFWFEFSYHWLWIFSYFSLDLCYLLCWNSLFRSIDFISTFIECFVLCWIGEWLINDQLRSSYVIDYQTRNSTQSRDCCNKTYVISFVDVIDWEVCYWCWWGCYCVLFADI